MPPGRKRPGKKNPTERRQAKEKTLSRSQKDSLSAKISKLKNTVANLKDFIKVNELGIKELGKIISRKEQELRKRLAKGGAQAPEIKIIIARNRDLFNLRRQLEMRRKEIYNKTILINYNKTQLKNLGKEKSVIIAKEGKSE